jgi:hypothetical protein
MQTNRLPDELVSIIRDYATQAATEDFVFHEKLAQHQLGDRRFMVWYEHHGLNSLSQVSQQLRRVCMPMLFSKMKVVTPFGGRQHLLEAIQTFNCVLATLPHIAPLIQYVYTAQTPHERLTV